MTEFSSTVTDQHHSTQAHATDCLNCGQSIQANFCGHCGQSAHTHAINWHYIWHEIPHSVGHLDKGILFTIRQLATRPGYAIREFFDGRRVSHYRPLSLLLLLGTVSVFAMNFLNVRMDELMMAQQGPRPNAEANAMVQKFITFMSKNMTLINIATLPMYAFWYWRLFRRGYNYPQLLVAQTFIASFNMLVSLLFIGSLWALGGSASTMQSLSYAFMLVYVAYQTITYVQLMRGKLPTVSVVWRSVVAYAVSYLSFIVIAGLIGFGWAIITITSQHAGKQPTSAQKTVVAPK